MAKTVGYTAAIVTKMILTGTVVTLNLLESVLANNLFQFQGEIQKRGMVRPLNLDVYRPALARLEDLGIKARRRMFVKDI